VDAWSAGLPHGLALALQPLVPNGSWVDLSGLVDSLRQVKSPAEQAYMRAAARISDAGGAAAIEAVRAGASERHIAAEAERAMIEAGGAYPGLRPLLPPPGPPRGGRAARRDTRPPQVPPPLPGL